MPIRAPLLNEGCHGFVELIDFFDLAHMRAFFQRMKLRALDVLFEIERAFVTLLAVVTTLD